MVKKSLWLWAFLFLSPIASSKSTDSIDTLEKKAPIRGKQIEKVKVTGSRIRQIDTEGSTPLLTISKEDLERAGSQSVSEVLSGLSSNSFGSRRESYGGQQSGNATINLRGIGSGRTLVLLNGRRISADPQTGAVDLNMIPIRAIERVEVLKAGASAIYGSDALSGVVNIILKKDFVGNASGARGFMPSQRGGAGTNFYYLTGADTKRYQFLSLLQYRRNHAVYNKDRTYFRDRKGNGNAPASFRGRSLSDGSDTNWQTSGCDPELLSSRGGNEKCLYWIDRNKTRLPDLDHLSMMTSINYQVNNNVEFFSQLYGSRKNLFWYWFPTSDQRNIIVPSRDVLGMLPAGANIGDAQNVEILTSMVELGRDERRVTSTALGFQGGFRGEIGDFTWEFGASSDHNFKVQKGSNQAFYDRLTASIKDNSFNPFAKKGFRFADDSDIDRLRADAFLEQNSSTAFYDFSVAGPLFDLPSGSLEVAFGVNYASYEYKETQDQNLRNQNIWGTFGGSDGGGSRQVTSVFFEALAPITNNLQSSLALRHDAYSDYGTSTTPAISARYTPFSWLGLRASMTNGFKAPTLYERNRAPTLQYVYPFEDYVSGITKSMYITQSGSKDIKEETSTSYNLGMILAPTSSLKLSVDYWSIRINDVIGYPDLEDVTRAESLGERISDYGVSFDRDATSGEIMGVSSTYMNLGQKRSAGFDIGIEYAAKLPKGYFRFKTNHSVMDIYQESGFPSEAPRDRIGERKKPRVRNQTKVSYGVGGSYGALGMRYVGAQPNSRTPISEYKNYSLSFGSEFSSGTKLTFGVKNLLDTPPPMDDHYQYDLLGRTYWAGIEQIF